MLYLGSPKSNETSSPMSTKGAHRLHLEKPLFCIHFTLGEEIIARTFSVYKVFVEMVHELLFCFVFYGPQEPPTLSAHPILRMLERFQ